MAYSGELKTLYNRLQQGETFGTFRYWNYYDNKPMTYPMFDTVLSKHYCKNLFCWTHYGSSANKATMKDLHWIITTIFQTTAKEFMRQYMTKTEYNHMKTAIETCGIH